MKLEKSLRIQAFESARLWTYAIFILNSIYIQFFFKGDTLCNHGYKCPTCGMRTAFNLLLHFKFKAAYESNHFIILLVIIGILIIIDICFIVGKRFLK